MDAFSLALSFGTIKIEKTKCLLIGGVVGVFHFFMPIVGSLFGTWFTKNLHIQSDFLEGIIFFYIAILMFKDFKNNEEESIDISLLGIIIFAFGVSLDSFGVGFALNSSLSEMIKSSLVFAVTSCVFTLLGLKLGNKLNSLIGEYSILMGAIIMSILTIINFCQFLL